MRKTKSARLAVMLLACLGTTTALADLGGVQHARQRLYATDVAQSEATRTQGSARGFTAFVAEDGVLALSGAYLLQGRAAIAAHLESSPLEGAGGTMSWEPLRWDVSLDGQVGYSVGRVRWEWPRSDGTLRRGWGFYVSTWRQDADGTWRLTASMQDFAGDDLGGDIPMTDLPESCEPIHDNGRHGTKNGDAAAFLAEVFATDAAFAADAVARGNAAAFHTYSSDDQYSPFGGGSCGRSPAPAPGAPLGTPNLWAPVFGEAASTGDLAWTLGPFSNTRIRNGQPRTVWGKYLSVWARQEDGTLRFIVDVGTASPPGPQL
jgi:ketosteroid isomerase-like protein